MTRVCVSKNLTADNGQLGLARQALATLETVHEWLIEDPGSLYLPPSSGVTTLPGFVAADNLLNWTNTYTLPCSYLVQIQRGPVEASVSNPNVLQRRDRVTYRVTAPGDYDFMPPDPDPSYVFDDQFTVGLDRSTNNSAVPLAGVLRVARNRSLQEILIGPVGPAHQVVLAYRAIIWTPPPYANNANAGTPVLGINQHTVSVRVFRIPALDPEVQP